MTRAPTPKPGVCVRCCGPRPDSARQVSALLSAADFDRVVYDALCETIATQGAVRGPARPGGYRRSTQEADSSVLTQDDGDAIAAKLNHRPRRVLGWATPAEAFGLLEPGRRLQLEELRLAIVVWIENWTVALTQLAWGRNRIVTCTARHSRSSRSGSLCTVRCSSVMVCAISSG